MVRLWVGTGVVVAVAVAAFLHFVPADAGGGAGGRPRKKPLTPADIDAFVATQSVHLHFLGLLRDASVNGEPMEPIRRRMEGDLLALAKKHHVTMDELRDRIWRRVADAVGAVRFDRDVDGQRSKLEARVKEYEGMMEGKPEGKLLADLTTQRDLYREAIRKTSESASAEDKEIVKTRWDDLDPLVPRTLGR